MQWTPDEDLPPRGHPPSVWNLHPHRTPCTACKDICPYGDAIFTRPNLVKDWDPCTDCGLCVSACRSGCIIFAGAGAAGHLAG